MEATMHTFSTFQTILIYVAIVFYSIVMILQGYNIREHDEEDPTITPVSILFITVGLVFFACYLISLLLP